MEFGINKCGMLVMKKGKIVESDGIQLPDGETIKIAAPAGSTSLRTLVNLIGARALVLILCSPFYRTLYNKVFCYAVWNPKSTTTPSAQGGKSLSV